MLTEKSKIKMVKEIGSPMLLNQVFDVYGIRDGVIEFGNKSYGRGVMSYGEFEKYFEVVKEIKSVEMVGDIKVIRNGRATIVILPNGIKGVSKCSPEDEYDPQLGYEIALARAEIKDLNRKLKMFVQ